PGHVELESLVQRLRELPPGRVHWEGGPGLARWGNATALSLIPYWTGHPTLSGLWRESSALYPFVRWLDAQLSVAEQPRPYATEPVGASWDPRRAVDELRMLGVRYLITHSPETGAAVEASAALAVARFGDLRLFDIGGAPLVSALGCATSAVDGQPFREQSKAWFRSWSQGTPTLVAAPGFRTREQEACSTAGEPARILMMDEEHIRFRTEHPGVPHLIRVSYFPNWRAQGARGPYLASPWFMVVIPQDNVVDLRFRATSAEWIGWLLTVGGVLGMGLWTMRPWRPRGVMVRPETVSDRGAR
ncbi:MAG TPA: hypothetical protein VE173_10310, partial [Longimicrobiales bacterium]|nr:hypothetical protein [Longimicrobiales bacterium]